MRAEEGILREVRNRNANGMLVFRKQKLGLTEGREGTSWRGQEGGQWGGDKLEM